MLSNAERLLSRKQITSIVDSTRRTLALWSGSVSAGKTIASLIAFLLAVRVAPRTGLIVVVGRTLQTVYQNVFMPLQSPGLFGSLVAAQVVYTPGATKATILGREVMVIGAHNAEAVGRIQGATIALAFGSESRHPASAATSHSMRSKSVARSTSNGGDAIGSTGSAVDTTLYCCATRSLG